MISDPSTAEQAFHGPVHSTVLQPPLPHPPPFGEGGSARPAGEGPGTESPSPAGPSARCCTYPGCTNRSYRSHQCKNHWDAYNEPRNSPPPEMPNLVACPDDLVPLAAQAAENDARQIFTLLWRAIGNWHLLEQSA